MGGGEEMLLAPCSAKGWSGGAAENEQAEDTCYDYSALQLLVQQVLLCCAAGIIHMLFLLIMAWRIIRAVHSSSRISKQY